MIINVHAGHNPDGKIACGAVGLIKESTEARAVKDLVINKLKSLGHTVYDCTCDNGKNQSDVLQQIVKKCNAHKADLDVSIHFNSGASDRGGNGKTTGTEVLTYDSSSKSPVAEAKNIVAAISALGFKNRGVKYRTDLYVLKRTTAPALLIECCFVDDKDDTKLYDAEKMAQAIVKGITGQTVSGTKVTQVANTAPAVKYYPACASKCTSIVDGLKSIGVDSSLTNRKKIAAKNGISSYKGDSAQNTKLLSLLKKGKLVRA